MSLKELRQKQADLVKEASDQMDLAEKAETDEQKEKFDKVCDEKIAELEKVKTAIARSEKIQAEQNALADFSNKSEAVDIGSQIDPLSGDESRKPFMNLG